MPGPQTNPSYEAIVRLLEEWERDVLTCWLGKDGGRLPQPTAQAGNTLKPAHKGSHSIKLDTAPWEPYDARAV